MEAKCSFSGIVGGSCTYERRDRAKNAEVISLLHCNREIAGHKSAWKIADVETEVQLILARASTFNFPANIAQLIICPYHRSSLGIGWRSGSQRYQIPRDLFNHSDEPKWPRGERGLGKMRSSFVY